MPSAVQERSSQESGHSSRRQKSGRSSKPGRRGRSSSEEQNWTFVQLAEVDKWTFVSLAEVDVRPASREDARPGVKRTLVQNARPRFRTLVQAREEDARQISIYPDGPRRARLFARGSRPGATERASGATFADVSNPAYLTQKREGV
ncbi:hypothetical protein LR48_Vigan541s003300 [Vigna angularis]|uniref:Uncharacterized protein n=1 Tax=Phaseolus angularis TaxID=3914 RepID=A0A0L9TCR1_PHAAN|nr:hypothetical protein LR48_Vigan541s003300 [Vigna angularis]